MIDSKEAIIGYTNALNKKKQEMINDMTPHDMVDMIFKQNSLLSQQSSQMIDIIDMANNIEKQTRDDEASKCKTSSTIIVYEKAMATQFVLFLLLILILSWMIYHYIYGSNRNA